MSTSTRSAARDTPCPPKYTLSEDFLNILKRKFSVTGRYGIWSGVYYRAHDEIQADPAYTTESGLDHFIIVLNEHIPREHWKVTIFQYARYDPTEQVLHVKQYEHTPDTTYMWTIPFECLTHSSSYRECRIGRIIDAIVERKLDNPTDKNAGWCNITSEETPYPSKLKLSDFYTYWSFRRSDNWYTILCPRDAPFSVEPIWMSDELRCFRYSPKKNIDYSAYGNRLWPRRPGIYRRTSSRSEDKAFKLPDGLTAVPVGGGSLYRTVWRGDGVHTLPTLYLPEIEPVKPKVTTPSTVSTGGRTASATTQSTGSATVHRCISDPMPDDKPEVKPKASTGVKRRRSRRDTDSSTTSDTEVSTSTTVNTPGSNGVTTPTSTANTANATANQPTLMSIVEDLRQYLVNEITRLMNP